MSKLETDVAIVAGGAAGLTAAVTAGQAGAKVVVLEKAATTGGTGNMGMGPLGIESRQTRKRLFGPTKDEAFRIFMDYTHWRVDARLVREYLNRSGGTIDWLESLGVEFVEPAAYFPGSQPTWHLIKPATGEPGPMAAATMMRILTDKAKELGATILLRTPVQKLIEENGRVVGALAEDAEGETVEVRAKAVVIATGGFGDSPELIEQYTGYRWGDNLFSFRVPGLRGDGIRMAWEAGAARDEMNMEIIFGMPEGGSLPSPVRAACHQPHLMVNLLGERFLDEGIMSNTTFTGNAIFRQKASRAFLIFDDEIRAGMEVHLDLLNRVFPSMSAPGLAEAIQALIDGGYEHLVVADTLEELAAKTGIDAAGLARTVEEYNASCDRGYDDVFAKDHRYLRPIRTPRFYAATHRPGAYGSLGGIKINHRAEVLDDEWHAIPGLYAAGVDACSIFLDSYVFVLPGNTMGFSVNTGRIAGEHAAGYARQAG